MYFRGERMENKGILVNGLDEEWLELIFEARNLGISKETVRDFLNQREVRELVMENP